MAISDQEPNTSLNKIERQRSVREWLVIIGAFMAAAAAIYQSFVISKQARDFEDQERRQLRAYVNYEKASADIDLPRYRVRLDMRNWGQTPAYNLKSWAGTDVLAHFPTSVGATGTNTLEVGPSAPIIVGADGSLTPEDIASIKSGEKSVYFWGIIEYDDTFGTHHRAYFNLRGTPGKNGKFSFAGITGERM